MCAQMGPINIHLLLKNKKKKEGKKVIKALRSAQWQFSWPPLSFWGRNTRKSIAGLPAEPFYREDGDSHEPLHSRVPTPIQPHLQVSTFGVPYTHQFFTCPLSLQSPLFFFWPISFTWFLKLELTFQCISFLLLSVLLCSPSLFFIFSTIVSITFLKPSDIELFYFWERRGGLT